MASRIKTTEINPNVNIAPGVIIICSVVIVSCHGPRAVKTWPWPTSDGQVRLIHSSLTVKWEFISMGLFIPELFLLKMGSSFSSVVTHLHHLP